jgi:hypothetical protein
MSNDAKSTQKIRLNIEQKLDDRLINYEDNEEDDLIFLENESKTNLSYQPKDLLKINLPNLGDKTHNEPHNLSPCTPEKTLIQDCNNFVMFTPKPNANLQHPSLSGIDSYPSTFKEDAAIDNEEDGDIKPDEVLKWIEKYYLTTSCGPVALRAFRFLRMACFILPILSIFGSLFSHTTYLMYAVKKSTQLWALIIGIKSNTQVAEILGILTIGIENDSFRDEKAGHIW